MEVGSEVASGSVGCFMDQKRRTFCGCMGQRRAACMEAERMLLAAVAGGGGDDVDDDDDADPRRHHLPILAIFDEWRGASFESLL